MTSTPPSTRRQKLEYVFDVLALSDEAIEYLTTTGTVTTITRLVNVGDDWFGTVVEDANLSEVDISEIIAFKLWYWTKFLPEGDIVEQLTHDSWEKFCSAKAPGATTTESTSSDSATTKDSVKIKTDLRHYPTFDGRLEKWTTFKRKFLAVAIMHGHGDILAKDYKTPSDPADAKMHAEHGHVIHSALVLGLAGGTAILKVVKHDLSRDGALAWADLIEWYEGQGSMEAIAKRAMETLQTLQLTRGTRNGAEGYISRFEQAIQDLHETNHEYDEVMKKITFLSGIRDPQYDHLCAILKLDNTRSYEQCVMEVRRSAIDIESTRSVVTGGNGGMRGGRYQRGIQRRANRLDQVRTVTQQIVPNGYIASNVWNSMSSAEREEVIRKRANAPQQRSSNNEQQQRRRQNGNGGERTDRRGGALPRQYAGNANRTTVRTSHPNNGNDNGGDNGYPVQRARNVVRARANVTRAQVLHVRQGEMGYRMPTRHAKTISARATAVSMDSWDLRSMLICDSASDVFLMGKGSRVLRYYPDTFNLKGYNDSTKHDSLVPMADLVTVIQDRQGHISMFGIRQGAHMPDNHASLLPIYEMRENDWIIDDKCIKHGGTQSMTRSLKLAPEGGRPNPDEVEGDSERMIFESDGRFLGLMIRPDLVDALDLSGDPSDPGAKNPQYSFRWLNEWQDLAGKDSTKKDSIQNVNWTGKPNQHSKDESSESDNDDDETRYHKFRAAVDEKNVEAKPPPIPETNKDDDSDVYASRDDDEESYDSLFGPWREDETDYGSSSDPEIDFNHDDIVDVYNDYLPNDDDVAQGEEVDYVMIIQGEAPAHAPRQDYLDADLEEGDAIAIAAISDYEDESTTTDSDVDGESDDMEQNHTSDNSFFYPESRRIYTMTGEVIVNDDKKEEILSSEETLEKDYLFVEPKIKKETKQRPFKAKIAKFDVDLIIPKLGWLPEATVKQTLLHTTQLIPRMSMSVPMRRHFRSRTPALNRKRLSEEFATDTWFASVPALGGIDCTQLFVGLTSSFAATYGMTNEAQGSIALEDFIRQYGAPYHLRSDNSKMQTGHLFTSICRRYNISQSWIEPHHQQQNPAERRIQDIKRVVNQILDRTGAPEELWFLCTEYTVYLLNRTSLSALNNKTAIEVMTGETPDISNLLQFEFFEPVYYYDPSVPFPASKECLGHFVGIAENVGDTMTFKVLTDDTQEVIARSTIRSATLGATVNKRLPTQESEEGDDLDKEPSRSDEQWQDFVQSTNDTLLRGQAPIIDPDTLIGISYVGQHQGVDMKKTVTEYNEEKDEFTVVRITGDEELVSYNKMLDVYNREEDPEEKLWTFNEITDHRTQAGKQQVEILWTNGETSWEPVSVIRATDPLTLARYAQANQLTEKRGWKWAKKMRVIKDRVIRMIRERRQANGRAFVIKGKTKKQKQGPKYKFGVRVPRGVKQSRAFDEENGNTQWGDAIKKEVSQLMEQKTFRVLAQGEHAPAGYQMIPLHHAFDVKYDGRYKNRIVAGGNHTDLIDTDMYSGVVSIDTVRLVTLVGVLNGLSCIATDISVAYLHGRTREKVYTVAGPEFGPDIAGRTMIIEKALYGLRTSAARWHEVLSDTLRQMGWSPSYADPNVWIKDIGTHYEYICTWVDDLLIFSKNPMDIIRTLEKRYTLKGTGVPEYYLGGNIEEIEWAGAPNNKTLAWSAKTYITNVTERIEKLYGKELKNYQSPMESTYKPELDATELLTENERTQYQMLVGCGNWVITLGRYDVHYAVSTMARYSAAPRQGHVAAMLRIFGYLKYYKKHRIVVDPTKPDLDKSKIVKQDWQELYPGLEEELPPNMLIPKGKSVKLTTYFDADHGSDQVTRKSVSGILMYANRTAVKWYCKRQNTVESSTYGSELVAGRIATEMAMEMRYKLRMLGVPIDGAVTMYGDNMSVIQSTSVPSSVLKKKHNAIAWHRLREAVASGVVEIIHVRSEDNLSDCLTKGLGPIVYERLVKPSFTRVSSDDSTYKGSDEQ